MELTEIDPKMIVESCPGLAIGRFLKMGGQKRVWHCAYQDMPYVLKALIADDETLKRVKREIEVMRECCCPFLPRFGPLPLTQLEIDPDLQILYFLEEYIDGPPLCSVSKPMSEQQLIRLASCVGQALDCMSAKGYVHRDVKPMNIIAKTEMEYVLIDAGFALDFKADAITRKEQTVGTRHYLSPEQLLLSAKHLDIRSDLFSLGITLYECATSQHPFWNDEMPSGDVIHNILNIECIEPRLFNADLCPSISRIIMRLLAKMRESRYQNFSELNYDLKAVAKSS